MEILRTKRLIIRQVEKSDASFLMNLVNSPGWLKYIGDRNVKTVEQANAYTDSYISDYTKNGFGFYVMVQIQTGDPIGISGLIKRPELEDIDFGFAILPAYYKQGYTYEASAPILAYALETFKINTLLGITTEDNIASQRLLEKLGFKADGKIDFKSEILLKYKLESKQ